MADHTVIESTFATRYMAEPIPKLRMPEQGIPANVVSQVIKDMRTLDARPNLNLASFVTTWSIANRCVSMLASLYNSPAVDENGVGDAVGTASVGSSEAIMLGALALKKIWAERRVAQGKDVSKPNLVMGSETHVCWEKFCRYFDVEARYVLAEEGRYAATPELLAAQCDENTIGVVAVLGSTYTGEFEDVAGIDAVVQKLNDDNGWNIKIHVDGASGAFVAPFIYPDVIFDFRLPNAGVGWAIWRDASHLPESMVFYCDYLGTLERSITLNFSRGASQIVAQYYQLLRLGKEGYTKIMSNLSEIAAYIRNYIVKSDHFELLSKEVGVPLVAFKLKSLKHSDGSLHKRLYDEFEVADRLRIAG